MATAKWPEPKDRSLIGKRIDRMDGPVKATGRAQYSYDVNLPGMLWARVHISPHPHAKVVSIDGSAAESVSGVRAVWIDKDLIDAEVQYAGQILAAVAADTEEIATEAVEKIKVQYEVLDHQVVDHDPQFTEDRATEREEGDVAGAFASSDVVVEGEYGIPVITHCCLESHGQVTSIRGDELYIWPSTQNVSRYADRLDEPTGIQRSKMHVNCQYMGGGFGSKFGYDKWGVIGALLSKQTGRPVKLMLERDQELMVGGNRPSAYGKFKVGANKDGTVNAFEADVWGTGGTGGYRMTQLPYVFTKIANTKLRSRGVRTNRGGQRAWRAPSHPQCCFLTMAALEDAAAAIQMDALEFFDKNIALTDREDVYREQLKIAADLIDYKRKSHLRGDRSRGSIKRGLGISMHTWGGLGHDSECDLTINPDGSVSVEMGTQDLGTATRSVLAIVAGETLGLPFGAVDVNIGRNAYPASGASGGSTTVGGVSTATRFAATDALNALLEVAAPQLGVGAEELEAKEGRIREINHPSNYISWKEACSLLGLNSITKRGVSRSNESREQGFIDSGVGGVQIAEVSVDADTGVVTLEEMVGVQDCGLIIDMKTAESQVYGALIMGITYSLYEEALYDPTTGRMLNADMEFYRLAGIKDIGKLKVHMMTGKKYEERGVIGLGEPPVISPGAAISNAVANAIGVRVPHLPLTPDRVIDAIMKGGMA